MHRRPPSGREAPYASAQRRCRPAKGHDMDILYLLIPLSVVLVLAVLAGLWWAVDRGQFENVDQEAERILKDG